MGNFIMWRLVPLLIGILIWAVAIYNKLQKLAQEVREKSSNMQIAISKKLGLVNQLIDVVKNFQEGEQLVHLKVSQDTSAMTGVYQQAGTVLASVQGLADKFPNLKSNEQYHRLIDSIQICEDDIQKKRSEYNQAVKSYNTSRVKIPTVFVARTLSFPEAPYLEFDMSGINEITTLKDFKTDDGERLQQLLSGAGNKVVVIAGQVGKAGKDLVDRVKEQQLQSKNDDSEPKNDKDEPGKNDSGTER